MKSCGSYLLDISKYHSKSNKYPGFTVVELLVVIVVIGILAVVTVTTYSGITQKAAVTSLTSDLNNASKLLKMDQAVNGIYPSTLALANSGKGVPSSPDTTFEYFPSSSGFCITATKDSTTYRITSELAPIQGDCSNYGLVLYVDAGDIASYPGSGTTVYDLTNLNSNITSYDPSLLISDGAFDFSATNTDGLNIQNNNFTSLRDFTVECLFNLSGTHLHYDGTFVSSGDWNNSHWAFGVNQTNSAVKTRKPHTTTSYTFSLNTWYHIYFTRQSTKFTIYINGNKLTEYTITDSIPLISSWTNTSIGRETYANGYFNLNGKIALVRIYSRALGDGEVTQNFNSIRERYGI